MLAEGASVYKDLYESISQSIVSCNKRSGTKGLSATCHRLKSILTRTEGIYFYINKDITPSDLEKKIDLEEMY